MPIPAHKHQVSRFYDSNTGFFLGLGHSDSGSIHRAVWGEGVQNRTQALHYVEELICDQITRHCSSSQPHITDLGCGVAASLCYIGSKLPVTGTGVTISAAQCRLAAEKISGAGLETRLHCVQGDFCDLPQGLAEADLAYAIEAFVHAEDADAFFREAASVLKPGARLIICDDFLHDAQQAQEPETCRWLQRFRQGWLVSSLLTPEQADILAARHGFTRVDHTDLSPKLELRRLRDRLISLFLKCFDKTALKNQYLSMLYGGDALQHCLLQGWIRHQFIIWELAQKQADDRAGRITTELKP